MRRSLNSSDRLGAPPDDALKGRLLRATTNIETINQNWPSDALKSDVDRYVAHVQANSALYGEASVKAVEAVQRALS